MNLNIREADWYLDNIVFDPSDREWGIDSFMAYLTTLASSFASLFFVFWGLDEAFLPSDLAFSAYLFTSVVTGVGMANIARLHILKGVPGGAYMHDYRENKSGDFSSYNLQNRVKEYLRLDKTDRAEYPRNIIETCKNPDLTAEQRLDLDRAMSKVYDGIIERRNARAVVTSRQIDLSPVLEALERSRMHLDSDIETYKEYN